MTELYRNDHMVADVASDLLRLAWHREEPDDDHAVRTAGAVKAALTRHAEARPGERFRILIDLLVVSKTFPRSTASYAGWLLSNRARVKGGAFCTRSLLLRAGISAALLIPGLNMKGFKELGTAQAYLDTL